MHPDLVVLPGSKSTVADLLADRARKRVDEAFEYAQELVRGTLDNQEKIDDLIDKASRHGIRVHLTLTGPSPRWANASRPSMRPCPETTPSPVQSQLPEREPGLVGR